LTGKVEVLVRNELYQLCRAKEIDIEEINIQADHVHMIVTVPPKHSISSVMGWLKGKTALKIFKEQKEISKKYWGKHVWSRGYCVSTIGFDEEKIRTYVKWQQEKEQRG
jgi:putative transposase